MKATDRITFGKYRGRTWEEVKQEAPDYLLWFKSKADNGPIRDLLTEMFSVSVSSLGLADDQATAVSEMTDNLFDNGGKVHRLQGGAGYGKSFAITAFIQEAHDRGYTVNGLAQSYVATQVMRESMNKVGADAKTVASGLLMSPDKTRRDAPYNFTENSGTQVFKLLTGRKIVLVDEYSMVPDLVADKLLNAVHSSANAKLVAIGDGGQIHFPSQEHLSKLHNISPVSELTIPKRFAPGSDLHKLEMAARRSPFEIDQIMSDLSRNGSNQISDKGDFSNLCDDFVQTANESPDETTLMLFFRRDHVAAANNQIRRMVFGPNSNPIEDGEQLRVVRTTFMDTDHRFYSGTTIRPTDIEMMNVSIGVVPGSVQCLTGLIKGARVPLIFSKNENQADPAMPGSDDYNKMKQSVIDHCKDVDNWSTYNQFKDCFLQVAYGYATTVHRSQGGSIDNIYFCPADVLQGGSMAPKLAYVAATRAKKKLNFYNR